MPTTEEITLLMKAEVQDLLRDLARAEIAVDDFKETVSEPIPLGIDDQDGGLSDRIEALSVVLSGLYDETIKGSTDAASRVDAFHESLGSLVEQGYETQRSLEAAGGGSEALGHALELAEQTLDAFAPTLDAVRDRGREAFDQLAQDGDRLQAVLEADAEAAEGFKTALAQIDSSNLQEVTAGLESAKDFARIIDEQAAAVEHLGEATSQVGSVTGSASSSADKFGNAIARLGGSAGLASNRVRRLLDAAEGLRSASDAGEGFAGGLARLAAGAAGVIAAVGLITSEIKAIKKEFGELGDAAGKAFPDAAKKVGVLADAFDRLKAGSLSLFRAGLKDLSTELENYAAAGELGIGVTDRLAKRADEATLRVGRMLGKLREQIEEESKGLKEATEDYSLFIAELTKTGKIDDPKVLRMLGPALEEIAKKAKDAGEQVSFAIDSTVERYHKLVSSEDEAAQAQKRLAESFEVSDEAAKKASDSVLEHVGALDKQKSALLGNVDALRDETDTLLESVDEIARAGDLSEEAAQRASDAALVLVEEWEAVGEKAPEALKALAKDAIAAAAEVARIADEAERSKQRIEELGGALTQAQQDVADAQAAFDATGPQQTDNGAERGAALKEEIAHLQDLSRAAGLTSEQFSRLFDAQSELNQLRRSSQALNDAEFDQANAGAEAARQLNEAKEREASIARDLASEVARQTEAQRSLAAAQANASDGASSLAEINEQLGNSASEAADNTASFGDKVFEVGRASEQAGNNTLEFGDRIIKVGEDSGEAADKIKDASDSVAEAGEKIGAAGDGAEKLATGLERSADAASGLPDKLSGITDKASDFVDGLADPTEATGKFADEIERAGSGAEAVGSGLEAIVDAAGKLPDTLSEAGDAIGEFTSTESGLTAEVEKQLAAFQSLHPEVVATFQEGVQSAQQLIQALDEIPDKISAIIDKLKELDQARSEGGE